MDQFKPIIPLGSKASDKLLTDAVKADNSLTYLVGPVASGDLIRLCGVEDWNYEFVDEVSDSSYKLQDVSFELEAKENGEIFVEVNVGDANLLNEEEE